jgi:hypothetical protein
VSKRMGSGPGRTLVGLFVFVVLAGAIAAGSSQAKSTADFIPSEQEEVPSCDPFGTFHESDFPKKPTARNKWVPITPGRQYVLEGRANRGGGPLPHTIVSTVTDLTKVIDGVRARVLWDVDLNEGTVQESELSFWAEDESANIWLLGEYPEEYDAGIFKGAPLTWLGGLAGATPGVQVPARPSLSGPSYIQALAPSVGFFDCGKDVIKRESLCVPYGCFDRVYVVEEWNPLDPDGGFQTKYYAPWVGNISIGAVNDPEGETLVMTDVHELDKAALKVAHDEALKLDERGYLVSDVYRQTEPAQPGGHIPPIPEPGPPPAPPAGPAPVQAFTGQTTTVKKKKKHKKHKKHKRCSSKRHGKSKGKKSSASKRKRCGSKRRKHR